jgi:hypothetical protein
MNEQGEYRAYVTGSDGHILKANGFVAENDDAAFEYARRFVDSHDIELWSGARLVGKLKRTE